MVRGPARGASARRKPPSAAGKPASAPGKTASAPRRTSLALLGDGLLEACWLAALVVVPLYFNPRTERAFEPDKLAWVLLLGLVAAVALVMRLGEATAGGTDTAGMSGPVGGAPARSPARSPVAWSAAFATLAVLMGALASTVPAVTWWGLYRRGQGVPVFLALVLLAAAAALTGRGAGARWRLARATSLTVVPVALYALLQRWGIDNIAWGAGADAAARAFGSLGNPIFLGAWLVMALPVSVAGLLVAVGVRRESGSGGWRPIIGHGSAVILGLAGLIVSQSRGPVLGLLAGAATFVLLWAASTGRRRLAVGLVAGGAVGVAALLVLAQTDGSALGRLGGLLAAGSRTAQQRLLLWDALGSLAASDPARAVIGYGPETMAYQIGTYLPEALVRLAPDQVFDRAHNVVWEWWVSAGAVGVAALTALYVSAFAAVLRQIGLGADRTARVVPVTAMLAGAMLGAVLPMLIGSPAYASLGAPLGLVAGLGFWLVWRAMRGDPPAWPPDWDGSGRPQDPAAGHPSWLTMALGAALVAHLVEGALGLPTAAGEVCFWVYLGLLMAGEGGRPRPTGRVRVEAAPSAADGLLDGIALVAVIHAPLLVPSRPGAVGHVALWAAPIALWVVVELIVGGDRRGRAVLAARLAVVALGVGLLALLDPYTGGRGVAFGITLVATTVAMAVLRAPGLRDAPSGAAWRWVVSASAGVLAGVGVWQLALNPVVADAHVRAGLEAAAGSDLDGARTAFEQAADRWPAQPAYATYLAAAYRERMVDPGLAAAEQAQAFGMAESVLADAYRRVPDLVFPQRLGALYRDRADTEANPITRRSLLAQARGALDGALAVSPHDPGLLAERASVLERLGETGPARSDYARATDLGAGNVAWLVGLARTALAEGDVSDGESALRRALDLAPAGPEAVGLAVDAAARLDVPLLGATATQVLYLGLAGRLDEARQLQQAMAAQIPDDPAVPGLKRWLAERRQ